MGIAPWLAAAALVVGCSSSSTNSTSGDGGGAGGGGSCPAAIPTGQGPFNDNACQALNNGDFSAYGATLTSTQLAFPTVCGFSFTYSYGGGGVEQVSFNPGCQYDSKRAELQQLYMTDAGPDGPEAVTAFEDLPNLGDQAFYYYQGGDDVVVLYKNVMTIVDGTLCNDPLKDAHCDGTPQNKAALISIAGVVVSRM